MKIISFAWTVDALLEGKKTCTRRCWADGYARRFNKGELCQAFDRSPRVGGKRLAVIELTCDPYQEPLREMTDEEEKAEGGLWGSAAEFVEAFCAGAGVTPDFAPWVIRFRLDSIEG